MIGNYVMHPPPLGQKMVYEIRKWKWRSKGKLVATIEPADGKSPLGAGWVVKLAHCMDPKFHSRSFYACWEAVNEMLT